MPKAKTRNFGMPEDQKARVALVRVDNVEQRKAVKAARKLIYKDNEIIKNAAVERLLKGQSLHPTDVCLPLGLGKL